MRLLELGTIDSPFCEQHMDGVFSWSYLRNQSLLLHPAVLHCSEPIELLPLPLRATFPPRQPELRPEQKSFGTVGRVLAPSGSSDGAAASPSRSARLCLAPSKNCRFSRV